MDQQPDPPPTFEGELKKLPKQQQRFVKLYLQYFNASRAARECGVDPTNARNQGYRWKANDDIARVIELGMEKHGIGKFEVLARQKEIATASIEDFISIQKTVHFEERTLPAAEALDLIRDEMALLMEEIESAPEERQVEIKGELKHYRREERRAERAMTKDPSALIRVGLERVEQWQQQIDLKKAEDAGVLHLLKSVKKSQDGSITITLHDSQKALEWFGDHYGLTSKNIKLGDPEGKPLAPGVVMVLPSNGRDGL